MTDRYYSGTGDGAPRKSRPNPPPARKSLEAPERYVADPGLVDAVNVALVLGQPILLTGEPGTGKSQLAYSLAWELALGEPLRFDTKRWRHRGDHGSSQSCAGLKTSALNFDDTLLRLRNAAGHGK